MMFVSCPHCKKPVVYDPSSANECVTCPHCNQEVQFPTPPARARKEEEQEEVPEETVVGNRYPGLKIIAGVYLAVAAIYVLGGLYCVWTIVPTAIDGAPTSFLVPGALLAGCVLAALSCWGISELIHLFINVADDMRITRLLLKRLVHGNKDADKNT